MSFELTIFEELSTSYSKFAISLRTEATCQFTMLDKGSGRLLD